MTNAEMLMVLATIVGPIAAVQAQKWVERARASVQRQEWVFTTLMATRQDKLGQEHVRALNSIDLAFYGTRIFGVARRSRKAQDVVDAWHEYHAHLNIPVDRRPKTEAEQGAWNARSEELFTNLLERLATATRFKFERENLKTGSYSPEAHGIEQLEQQALRRGLIEVISGNRNLPLELRAWPVDEEVRSMEQKVREEQIRLLCALTRRVVGLPQVANEDELEASPARPGGHAQRGGQ